MSGQRGGVEPVELTMDDLRAVARYAAGCAADVLPVFETAVPDDPRPRAAVEAARLFAEGAARTNAQRSTAVAAHRAAGTAPSEPARLAAQACGDAAASAYLHPIARSTQVGHVLRAAACAALVAELTSGVCTDEAVRGLAGCAEPPVPDVLRRYPPAAAGRSRLAQVMVALDTAIRAR